MVERITLARLRRMIRRGHPDAANLRLVWHTPMRPVTWPSGLRGRCGRVRVHADGYRSTLMLVSEDATGISIE